jgi:hypothetical protein
MGKTYAGDSLGQVLQHVVLTNSPFVKGMNIAASRVQGSEPVAYHFTALHKEAAMADPKKKTDPDPAADATGAGEEAAVLSLTERLEAAEVLLQEKEGAIREMAAANANLIEEVKAYKKSPQLVVAMRELDQQKRINLANKVRFITARVASDRQVNMDVLRGWYDHDSDEVVLAGFKASQFKGSLDLLQYHRDSVKKNPSRAAFATGDPGDDGATGLTADDKAALVAAGKDPEVFAATRGARNFTDYKRLKAEAQKKGA